MTLTYRPIAVISALLAAGALLAGCSGAPVPPEPPGSGHSSPVTEATPEPQPEAPRVVEGSVEVKIERTETDEAPRLFAFEATECAVSRDRVTVVADGVEEGEGTPAQLVVDIEYGALLHEGTQTITAKGEIVLTVAGERWVSDGRPDDRFGVMMPSMFEYRVDGGYGEFRTAWFEDAGARESGFVHVYCARP